MTLIRRSFVLLALLFAAAAAILVAQSSGHDERDATRLVETLGIRAGTSVGEIGAGDGSLAIEVSRVVGDTGRVFATELGDDRIATLKRAVERAKASNIQVLAAGAAQANLDAGCCDALYMRNVYHHFDDPRAMNASLFEALRPGGMLGVMDFAPRQGATAASPSGRDSDGNHGVAAETIAEELKQAGFEIVSTETQSERRERGVFVVARKPQR